ncbi:DNA polymerase IV [Caldisericum exile]|uniref:DNA polymerase IV n=1 Tax=Caldisericum exile (strain DSM 21853 / NBRC 104410 / AZM16c01) TaxID=511051 RepID=A0A7U6GEZ8_CALEA|nr:DNA polymerase IV [Caldisericum exile]BAL81163.1 DNA polymerase IV [Caldisericum exile AZM16c01]
MEKIIAHIDMDAFFASIEQVRRPWLKGKPIGVTNHPDGRSVIATASYEARAYGIKSGMPVKEALKLFPDLILVKGDANLYEKISDGIYEILIKYAPNVERFSIDEAFLDLTYKAKDYEEARTIGINIKKEIFERFSLPSTIGISYNKLVAKIASKEAKPNGLLVVRKEEADHFLKKLPVSKIPGVGKKIEEALKKKFNVETIEQLQKIELNELIKVFHTYGVFIYNAAHGIDNSEVIAEFEKEEEKSVGNSTTLDFDTDDIEIIKGVLRRLSSNVCYRLRLKNLLTERITLTIRYEDFSTFSHSKNIPKTNLDSQIYSEVLNLFFEIYNGQKVRLLGVTARHLSHIPYTLFEHHEDKNEKLASAIDKARIKMGDESVSYANSVNLRFRLANKKISGGNSSAL